MSEEEPQYLSPATMAESRDVLGREEYGDTVLDVGAGNLAFTEHLYDQTGDETTIIATDLPGVLDPRLSAENVHYVEGNAADFVRNGVADTVYAVNVIQLSNDPKAFLESLENARSPEGVTVISFPDEEINMGSWPEISLKQEKIKNEDVETEFNKLSVPQKETEENYEQLFIPSGWVEERAEEMGLNVLDKGRVPINTDAMEEIAKKVADPKYLPGMDASPEETDPSVKYYVLGD